MSAESKRSLTPSLEPPPHLRLENFLLLTSSWLAFYWYLHLLTSRRPFSKRHKLSPLFCLSCREQKHQLQLALRMRTRFWTSSFPLSFSALLFSKYCRFYSFIFHLFNFLWAVQLRYTLTKFSYSSFGVSVSISPEKYRIFS